MEPDTPLPGLPQSLPALAPSPVPLPPVLALTPSAAPSLFQLPVQPEPPPPEPVPMYSDEVGTLFPRSGLWEAHCAQVSLSSPHEVGLWRLVSQEGPERGPA